MRKFLLLFFALAMLAPMFFSAPAQSSEPAPVITINPAPAVEDPEAEPDEVEAPESPDSSARLAGCKSDHRFQVSGRSQNEYFHEPITMNKVPYRVTLKVVYIYCPNGRSSWKLQPRSFEGCWKQYDDETNHRMFDGVTFNPRYGDKDQGLRDRFSFKVGDDGTRENCGNFAIPVSDLDWMWGFAGPQWASSFKLHLVGANDHDHYFGEGTTDGPEWKSFHIKNDDVLTGWIR